ncbi:hypothetical protein TNCV_4295131 [Trichonephila clavipes]|uniref:Uncharacterized protein n=1 Tax=Trichonephila clavipes TaxID=2585209 RepID=A0A8X6V489_TRICX|nr:hypothetical protein TNCV_4295131 [Trichonephila clavipes]
MCPLRLMNGDRACGHNRKWLRLHLIFPPSGMLAALVTIGVHFKSNTSRLHITWGFAFTLHSWPMLGFGNSSQRRTLFRILVEVDG